MQGVAQKQVLSQALLALYRRASASEFYANVTDCLMLLFPEGSISIDEVFLATGQVIHHTDRNLPNDKDLWAGWERYSYQHPGVQYVAEGGTKPILNITEMISRQQLLKLDLYQQVYRHIQVKDHTGIILPRPESGLGIGLLLPYEIRTFERDLLQFLYPHLVQAQGNCIPSEQGNPDRSPFDFSWELTIAEDGRINDWPQPLRNVLDSFFTTSHKEPWRPPSVLIQWTSKQLQCWSEQEIRLNKVAPLEIRHGNNYLKISLHRSFCGAGSILNVKGQILDKNQVRRFKNLTDREKELAHWIGCGKSNSEIAILLGISVMTVKKHLEHVFQKLGVENRTALAMELHAWRQDK